MTSAAQIETTFREEHGRILAALIGRLGDFTLAEDALQDALVNALERMARGAPAGLQMLLPLADQAGDFYPYHAACADLLRRTNQRQAAAQAYERALALCGNVAERAYLQRRLDEMRD
jgi:RNA polymerase sigma-70 factor (ECF subfamily)